MAGYTQKEELRLLWGHIRNGNIHSGWQPFGTDPKSAAVAKRWVDSGYAEEGKSEYKGEPYKTWRFKSRQGEMVKKAVAKGLGIPNDPDALDNLLFRLKTAGLEGHPLNQALQHPLFQQALQALEAVQKFSQE